MSAPTPTRGREGRSLTNSAGTASAVDRIATALRAAALDSEDGAFLGSEESLSDRFGVSAPTLRQAARLLEHEHVLKVRRGVAGGYYARRPRIDAITHVAATYLRGNPGSLDEVMVVMAPLTPVMVAQAIRSTRADAFAELEAFAAPPRSDPRPDAFREDEARFIALLIEMIENAPLRLILSIFYDFGALLPRAEGAFDAKLARRTHEVRAALARALIAKDSETALARMLEHQQLILRRTARSLTAARTAPAAR